MNAASAMLPPDRSEEPRAQLSVARTGDRSVVRTSFATSPLRLLTPRNHGRAAWVYTSTLGGGLVNGDRLQLDLSVAAGAACLLSTQGETRVYRSPRGCSNELRAKVEDGGLLAVIPDPTVCFAGADYFQRTEIALEPRAAVVFADVLVAGRSARGERWAFNRYAAELKLQLGCRRIVDETLLLDPAHGSVCQRFGRFDTFATLLLVGEALREVRLDLGQKLGALPLPARTSQLQSASALGEHALLIRMAAVSVEEVLQTIRAHLSFLPALLGDDPWSRRN